MERVSADCAEDESMKLKMASEERQSSAETKRASSISSSSKSEEDKIDGLDENAKEEKKKRKRITERIHDFKTKPKKDKDKNKGLTAIDHHSSDDESKKMTKRHLGVIEKIRRFGSREELDRCPNEEEKLKKKNKKKKKNKQVEICSDEGEGTIKPPKIIVEEASTGGLWRKHKTAKTLSDGSSSDDEDFAKDVLISVNSYRKIHRVKKLRANKELNTLAYEWATILAKKKCVQERRERQKYGRNIYQKTLERPQEKVCAEEVVGQWYHEIDNYSFEENPEDTRETRNATQLLWKNSTEIGIAKSRTTKKDIVFVAAYFTPPGNITGEYKAQVPPLGGFRSSSGHSSVSESTSSSENEETENKDADTKHQAKTGKKTFLSQMFHKIRKSSESDVDQAKKKDKENISYIGHRQGQYVVNESTSNSGNDPENKSTFYVITSTELKESRKNLRTTQDFSAESSEHHFIKDSMFDDEGTELNISTKLERSNTDDDDNEKKSSDKENLNEKQSRKNNSLTEEVLASLAYQSVKTINITNTSDDGNSKGTVVAPTMKQSLNIDNQGNDSILNKLEGQLENKSDDSSSSDDEDKTSKIKSEKEHVIVLDAPVKPKDSADKKPKGGVLAKFKRHLEKRHHTSSKDDDEKHKIKIEKEVTTSAKSETSLDKPRKVGVFHKLKGQFAKKTDDSSSSDDDDKKHKIKVEREFPVSEMHHIKDETTINKPEEKEPSYKLKFSVKNKSDDSSSSDGEEKRNRKFEKVSPVDEPQKTGILGKIKGEFEKKTDDTSSSSDDDNEKRTAKMEVQFLSRVTYPVKSETTISRPEEEEQSYKLKSSSKNKSDESSSSDEEKRKRKIEKVSSVYESQKIGIFGKIKDHFEKKSDDSSSSDDDDKNQRMKMEKQVSVKLIPPVKEEVSTYEREKMGPLDKLKSHLKNKSDESSSSDDEEKRKVKIEKVSSVDKPQKTGFFGKIKGQFEEKFDDSSSSDDDEDKNKKLEVEKEVSVKLTPPLKTEVSTYEPEKVEPLDKLKSHLKNKSDESSSSDDEEKRKVKIEKVSSVDKPQKTGFFGKIKGQFEEKFDDSSSSDDDDDKNKKLKVEKEVSVKLTPPLKTEVSTYEPEKVEPLDKLKSHLKNKSDESSSSDDEEKRKVKIEKVSSVDKPQKTGFFGKIKGQFEEKFDDSSSSDDDEDKNKKLKVEKEVSVKLTHPLKTEVSTYEPEKVEPLDKLKSHLKNKSDESSSSDDEEKRKVKIEKVSSVDKPQKTGFFGKLKGQFEEKFDDSSSSDDDDDKNKKLKVEKEVSVKLTPPLKTEVSTYEPEKVGPLDKLKSHLKNKSDESSSSDDEEKRKVKIEKISSVDKPQKTGFFGKIKGQFEEKFDESSSSDDDKNKKIKVEKEVSVKLTPPLKTEVSTYEPEKVEPLDKLKSHLKNKSDESSSSDDEEKRKVKIEKVSSVDKPQKTGFFGKLKGQFEEKFDDSSSSDDDDDKNKKVEKEVSVKLTTPLKTEVSTYEPEKVGPLDKLKSHLKNKSDESSSSDDEEKRKVKIEKVSSVDKPQKTGFFGKIKGQFEEKFDDSSSSDDDDDKNKKLKVEKEVSVKLTPPLKTEVSSYEPEKVGPLDKLKSHLKNKSDESSSSDDEEKRKVKIEKVSSVDKPQKTGFFGKIKGQFEEKFDESSSSDDDKNKKIKVEKEVSVKLAPPLKTEVSTYEPEKVEPLDKLKSHLKNKSDESSSSDDEEKRKVKIEKVSSVDKPQKTGFFGKIKGQFEEKFDDSSSSDDDDDKNKKMKVEKEVSVKLTPPLKTEVSTYEPEKVEPLDKLKSHLKNKSDESSSSDDEEKRKVKIEKISSVDKPQKTGFFGKIKGQFEEKFDESSSSDDDKNKKIKVEKEVSVKLTPPLKTEVSTYEPEKVEPLDKLKSHLKNKSDESSSSDDEEKRKVKIEKVSSVDKPQKTGFFGKIKGQFEEKFDDSSSSDDDDDKNKKLKVEKEVSVKLTPPLKTEVSSYEPEKVGPLDKLKSHLKNKSDESSSSDDEEKRKVKIEKVSSVDKPQKTGFFGKIKGQFEEIFDDTSSSDDDDKNKKLKVEKEVSVKLTPPLKTEVSTYEPEKVEPLDKLKSHLKNKSDESSSSDDEEKRKVKIEKVSSVDKPQKTGFFGKIKEQFEEKFDDSSSSDDDDDKNKKLKVEKEVSVKLTPPLKTEVSTYEPEKVGPLDKLKSHLKNKSDESSSSDDEEKRKVKIEKVSSVDKPQKTGFFGKIKGQFEEKFDDSSSSDDDDDKNKKLKVEKEVSVKLTPPVKTEVLTYECEKVGPLDKLKSHLKNKSDESSSSDDEEKCKVKIEKVSSVDKPQKTGFFSKIKGQFEEKFDESSSSDDDDDKNKKLKVEKEVSVKLTPPVKTEVSTYEPEKVGPLDKLKFHLKNKSDESSSSDDDDDKNQRMKVEKEVSVKLTPPLKTEVSTYECEKVGPLDKLKSHLKNKSDESSSSDDEEKCKMKKGKVSSVDEPTPLKPHISVDETETIGLLGKIKGHFEMKSNDSSSSDDDDDKNQRIKVENEVTVKLTPPVKTEISTFEREKVGPFDELKSHLKSKSDESSSSHDEEKCKMKIEKVSSVDKSQKTGFLGKIKSQFQTKTDDTSSSSDDDEAKHKIKLEKEVSVKLSCPVKSEATTYEPEKAGPFDKLKSHLKNRSDESSSSDDVENRETKMEKIFSVDESTPLKPHISSVGEPDTIGLLGKMKGHFENKSDDSSSSDDDDDDKTDRVKVEKEASVKLTPPGKSEATTYEPEKMGPFDKLKFHLKTKSDESSSSDDEEKRKMMKEKISSFDEPTPLQPHISVDEPETIGLFGKIKGHFEKKSDDSSSSDDDKNQRMKMEKEVSFNLTPPVESEATSYKPEKAGPFDKLKSCLKNKSDESSLSDDEEKRKGKTEKVSSFESQKTGFFGNVKGKLDKKTDDTSSSDDDDDYNEKRRIKVEKEVSVKVNLPMKTEESTYKPGKVETVDKLEEYLKKKSDDSSTCHEDEERHEIKVERLAFSEKVKGQMEKKSDDNSLKDYAKQKIELEKEVSLSMTTAVKSGTPPDKSHNLAVSEKLKVYLEKKTEDTSSSDDDKKRDIKEVAAKVTPPVKIDTSTHKPENVGSLDKLKVHLEKKIDNSSSSDDDHEKQEFRLMKESLSATSTPLKFQVSVDKLQKIKGHSERNICISSGSDDGEVFYRSSDNRQGETKPYSRESGVFVAKLIQVFESPENKVVDEVNKVDKVKKKCQSIGTAEIANQCRGKIDRNEFSEEILNSMNYYRSKHNAEKLALDEQLCGFAVERAKSFASGVIGNIHSSLGENIFIFTSPDYFSKEAAKFIVESWYNRIAYYQFDAEPKEFDTSSGPFTQLVWKSSKKLGVGFHENKEKKITVVAIFSPAGNVKGQFKNQIDPLICSQIDKSSDSSLEDESNGFTTEPNHDSKEIGISKSVKKNTEDQLKPFLSRYEGRHSHSLALLKFRPALQKKFENVLKNIVTLSDHEKFTKDLSDSINERRNKHGAHNLNINDQMCKDSLKWTHVLARDGKLKLDTDSPNDSVVAYETLHSSGTKILPQRIADSWFTKRRTGRSHCQLQKIDANREGNFDRIFSKEVREIGAAVAYTTSKKAYIVAYFK